MLLQQTLNETPIDDSCEGMEGMLEGLYGWNDVFAGSIRGHC